MNLAGHQITLPPKSGFNRSTKFCAFTALFYLRKRLAMPCDPPPLCVRHRKCAAFCSASAIAEDEGAIWVHFRALRGYQRQCSPLLIFDPGSWMTPLLPRPGRVLSTETVVHATLQMSSIHVLSGSLEHTAEMAHVNAKSCVSLIEPTGHRLRCSVQRMPGRNLHDC